MTSRTASNVVWSYIGWVSSIAAPLILIPLCVRFLGKQLYGEWLVILSAVGFLGLANLGLGQTVYNRVAEAVARRRQDDAGTIIVSAFYAYVAIAILVIVALVAALSVPRLAARFSTHSPMLLGAFAIYVVLTFASLPITTYLSALQGYERIDQYNAIRAAASAGRVAITAAALVVGFKLIALAIIQGGSALLQSIAGWILLRRLNHDAAPWPSRFSAPVCRELFKPSLGFFTLQVSHTMVFGVDNLIIGYMLGAVAVTRYAVPYRLLMVVSGLFATCLAAIRPTMTAHWARNEKASLQSTYSFFLRLALFYGVTSALVLWLAGPAFIRLWAGRGVFPGMTVFGLEIALLVIQVILCPADLILVATTRHYGYAGMAAMEAALNFGLSLWWAKIWGLSGVIAGTVAARIVTCGWYMLLAAHRTIGSSSRRLLHEMIPAAAVSGGAIAAVAIFYIRVAPLSGAASFEAGLAAAAGCALLCGRFGFTRQERQMALSWVSGTARLAKSLIGERVA